MTGPVRLSIDVGTASVCAVGDAGDGRGTPLLVDGSPLWEASVWLDPDAGQLMSIHQAGIDTLRRPDTVIAAPLRLLGSEPVVVAGRQIDPLDAVAVLLREAATHATTQLGGTPAQLILGVPAGWGPRRVSLLRQAAARAGLPVPHLVPEAVALAHHLTTTGALVIPEDGCLLVCDLGAASADISVLQHRSQQGWRVLASTPAAGAAGSDLNQALLAHLAARDGTDPALWQRLRYPTTASDLGEQQTLTFNLTQAKHTLARGHPAALLLTANHPPVLLHPEDLHQATTPAITQLIATVEQVIDTADVTLEQVAGIVCAGGGAQLPGLTQALHQRFTHQPVVPSTPQLALAHGLLTATPTPAPSPTPAVTVPAPHPGGEDTTTTSPPQPPHISRAAAALLPWVLAVGLFIQAMATTKPYRDQPGGTITYLSMNTAEYAMAALLALLGLLGGATATATALLYDAATTGPEPTTAANWRRHAGQLLSGAAGLGVLAAGISGLVAATAYPVPNSPFLPTALYPVLPTAAIAALVGLLAPRIPTLRATGWAHRLQQPLLPILLAAVGMFAATQGLYTTPHHLPVPALSALTDAMITTHLGGMLLGVGIALTLTNQTWSQLTASALLGLGGAIAVNLANTTTLGYAYIIAVTLWWATQTARITADATPDALPRLHRWWQRRINGPTT